ncbi:prokaryotic type I DNA topoisomerase [Agrocybe pediades]|nr:prokaryotic type I DNA topoisomerase [Agrocybe pediades]
MRVLCVAEKPSISKAITQILSGGQFTTHNSPNKYIKNYEFDYPQTRSFFTVTAVLGHLTAHDFPETHRKWHSCDSFSLFDAPVESSVASDKKDIEQNLMNQARRSDMLMIWTDCDREGEHIGMEIARVCRRAKANITVKRARFSAIIAQQIHNAAQHPVELDRRQADAVEARIILDLKVGAAFTRLQTMTLQTQIQQIGDEKNVVSYGPCQFPTLGFVVQRYQQVKNFVPEPFWSIHLALTSPGEEETKFNWKRNHLFLEAAVRNLFEMMDGAVAVVTRVVKKETKKWKPLPLTTVELQKAGSRLLRLSPKKVLDVAEKLYNQGFVSYPRTETDEFDNQFDHMSLIARQTADADWGAFATMLQNGGYNSPRKGKHNDKAHPPIHPTGHAGNLNGDEKKVYEYITRRYLACCSKDAVGMQTTVDVMCGGEEFSATGLIVRERNYLEVYPYDKWNAQYIPDFEENQEFEPTTCEVREGQTSKPNYLTEADLVTLMDKNGIGTDATIAQHIETIIDRNYVIARKEGATTYLIPSTLGIGLIKGYNEIGLAKNVSKPQLRRETERRMVQVCEGTTDKHDMISRSLDQYKEMFVIVRREFDKVTSTVRRYLAGQGDERGGGDGPAGGGGGGGNGGPGGGGGGDHGPGGGGRGRGRPPGRGAGRGTRGAASGRGRGRGGAPDAGSVISVDDSDDDHGFDPPGPRPGPSRSTAPRSTASTTSTAVPSGSRQTAPLHISSTWQVTSVTPTPNIASSSTRVPSSFATNNSSFDPNAVKCECGVPAIAKAAQTGASAGRRHWACATDVCKFFEWAADPAPSNSGGSAVPAKRSWSMAGDPPDSNAARQCECNEDGVLLTTMKEGANKGRKFWKCKSETCRFFEWDDEPPKSKSKPTYGANGSGSGSMPARAQSFSGAAGNDKSGDMCYKCNQTGHWQSSCPNVGGSDNKRTRSFGNSSNDPCYKCQKTGHWSSECPNPAASGSGSKGGAYSRKNDAAATSECFNCGKVGHWSKDCPSQKSGGYGGGFGGGGGGGYGSRSSSRKSSYSSGSGTSRRGRGGGTSKAKRGGRGGKKKSAFGAADDY